MGGLYGKLLIAAYITFITVMLGFLILGIISGRRDNKAPLPKQG
jgi:uncharacterized membrane protein